jgi:hypothetical protein
MPLGVRETMSRPQNERRVLQRKLDAQMEKVREFSGDRSEADEIIADWQDNAMRRLGMLCDIAFPMEMPSDPTGAAILLGRLQGLLEPLRKALDTVALVEQMQLTASKIRDRINDFGEEIDEG